MTPEERYNGFALVMTIAGLLVVTALAAGVLFLSVGAMGWCFRYMVRQMGWG